MRSTAWCPRITLRGAGAGEGAVVPAEGVEQPDPLRVDVRLQVQNLPGEGVSEAQAVGVQHEPVDAVAFPEEAVVPAVSPGGVADELVADVLEVLAYLLVAPGERHHLGE